MNVRCIVEGPVKGEVLYSSSPIAFLQGVDADHGYVSDPGHEIFKRPFRGKILAFPNSVGSSVGAYVIYRLKKIGEAPKAIINQSSDIITASGCAISGIPLYDLPNSLIKEINGAKKLILNRKSLELKAL